MPSARPSIVVYNTMYARRLADLPSHPNYVFSYDRALLPQAHAVMIYIPTLSAPWDVPKYPGQLWVAWSMESAENYPMLNSDSIMAAFDIRMTYERHSDVWLSYLPPDFASRTLAAASPNRRLRPHVAMFQSSSFDRSHRDAYTRRLMACLPIHSYGRHMRNRRLWRRDQGRETKLAIISRYKFCLGFENSIAPDYVTEKFYDPFIAGSLCVYRGAPNVTDFAPAPHSFINADDFPSPEALADHLRHLASDDAAYKDYFSWKQRGFDADYVRRVVTAGSAWWDRLAETVRRMRASNPSAPADAAPTYPLAWLKPRGLGAAAPAQTPLSSSI